MLSKLQEIIHKMILYDSKKSYSVLYSIVVFISVLMLLMVVYTLQDSQDNEAVSFVFFILILVIFDFWLYSKWWKVTTIMYSIFLLCQLIVFFMANKKFRSIEKSFLSILEYFFTRMCSWTGGPTMIFSLFRRYYIEAIQMKNRDHL
ncbi:unnamed protein product [Caenorhabditis brenneri]